MVSNEDRIHVVSIPESGGVSSIHQETDGISVPSAHARTPASLLKCHHCVQHQKEPGDLPHPSCNAAFQSQGPYAPSSTRVSAEHRTTGKKKKKMRNYAMRRKHADVVLIFIVPKTHSNVGTEALIAEHL